MQLKTIDDDVLMSIKDIQRDGNQLIIEGRIMDALPVRAVLTPEEGRKALRLLNFRLVCFLMTFLFRSEK